jgi:predicted RNA-binding protein
MCDCGVELAGIELLGKDVEGIRVYSEVVDFEDSFGMGKV